MAPAHPQRLRLRRIEAKPKEVRFVGSAPDIRIPLSDETAKDLARLRTLIQKGERLPDRYYRPSMTRRGDELLSRNGILHLHLKSIDDDAIVYLIQYEDSVLFICVDTHRHLRSHPPGAALRDDLIKRAERELLASRTGEPQGSS